MIKLLIVDFSVELCEDFVDFKIFDFWFGLPTPCSLNVSHSIEIVSKVKKFLIAFFTLKHNNNDVKKDFVNAP